MSNQTEELLRAGMERFTAETDVPPGLAARAARRRQRSKRAKGAAAVGVASVAAVTAVVVAGAAVTPGPARHARTAAYVVSRTHAALARAGSQNVIQYVRETSTAGIFIGNLEARTVAQWTYRGQYRYATYDSGGRITSDSSTVTAGHQQTTTTVDYQDKTWSRQTVKLSPPSFAATPESSCDEATVILGGGLGITDLNEKLDAALTCGEYVVAGTQRADRVQALELKPAKPEPVAAVFWVDPSTYLPVRDLMTIGSRATIRDDFRWLQPAQANLAALDAHIPAGFTQVTPRGH